jgi:hypothetical protein
MQTRLTGRGRAVKTAVVAGVSRQRPCNFTEKRGIDNHVLLLPDYEYSTELLAQPAGLGYAASAYRLGECYNSRIW